MTPRIENEARIDVLAVMDRAADKIESHTDPIFEDCELRAARDAVAELIDAARDVNYWLCKTQRDGTAHQLHLAAVLERCGVKP